MLGNMVLEVSFVLEEPKLTSKLTERADAEMIGEDPWYYMMRPRCNPRCCMCAVHLHW